MRNNIGIVNEGPLKFFKVVVLDGYIWWGIYISKTYFLGPERFFVHLFQAELKSRHSRMPRVESSNFGAVTGLGAWNRGRDPGYHHARCWKLVWSDNRSPKRPRKAIWGIKKNPVWAQPRQTKGNSVLFAGCACHRRGNTIVHRPLQTFFWERFVTKKYPWERQIRTNRGKSSVP